MDEATDRYVRLVRNHQEDRLIITPPDSMREMIDEMASDPRRPRTAIARFVSRTWAEKQWLDFGAQGEVAYSDAVTKNKEDINRPAHYPTDFGLGLMLHPQETTAGTWTTDTAITNCYTNLASPHPFDPHIHNGHTGADDGFGYLYSTASLFYDQYDLTSRRGGGPRGGFAFTTGPTEGNYPSTILPSPTFNLGRLGYTNGGWNPEGVQWMNRPRRYKLTNLRNNWPHKVFFCRSRQVFNRTIYGPLSEDEATPRSPVVLINGVKPLHGVLGISSTRNMNSPTEIQVKISSVAGRRSGLAKLGDTLQVFLAGRSWANPPLVFTGFVSGISEETSSLTLTALDTLGYLSNEHLRSEPAVGTANISTIIKQVIGESSYYPPIGFIQSEMPFTAPSNLKLKGKTRLGAIQTILNYVNAAPDRFTIYADAYGFIHVAKLPDIDDTDLTPYVAGRLPRTSTPQDYYPTEISRDKNDDDFFNQVTVANDELNFSATETLNSTERPVERYIVDNNITTKEQAKTIARQILIKQGTKDARWTVEGLPERFDFRPGDIIEFASVQGGLAGRKQIMSVSWNYTPTDSTMTLVVGREPADIASFVRLAASKSL